MEGAKQKVKDMASAAKHHAQISEAKIQEKAEQATARTGEHRDIAKEKRKVKEAEAKAGLHTAKAQHAEEKLMSKQQPYHLPGVGGAHHPATTGAGLHSHTPAAAAHVPSVGMGMGHQPVAGATGATRHHLPGHATTTTTTTYPPTETTGHHLPGRKLL